MEPKCRWCQFPVVRACDHPQCVRVYDMGFDTIGCARTYESAWAKVLGIAPLLIPAPVRITTTDNYYHDYGCRMDDCDRMYCSEHRLLYRVCDTAVEAEEGDRDVINGTRIVMESDGECPQCKQEERNKRMEREIALMQRRQVNA
jgi:hypothetical protein